VNIRRINWPLWSGLLLSLIAFISYFFVFVWLPITRDFPWANLILFALAVVLLVIGVRRAFTANQTRKAKLVASIVAGFGLTVLGLFLLTFFVFGRRLPPAPGAPQVGQKAPDFTLPDSNGKSVSLSELTSKELKGRPPRAVLLIFYRGYW